MTADIANSYNRDVFAVPGRVTDGQSLGCNNLIKTSTSTCIISPVGCSLYFELGIRKFSKTSSNSKAIIYRIIFRRKNHL